jgi:hypothetical protein
MLNASFDGFNPRMRTVIAPVFHLEEFNDELMREWRFELSSSHFRTLMTAIFFSKMKFQTSILTDFDKDFLIFKNRIFIEIFHVQHHKFFNPLPNVST